MLLLVVNVFMVGCYLILCFRLFSWLDVCFCGCFDVFLLVICCVLLFCLFALDLLGIDLPVLLG